MTILFLGDIVGKLGRQAIQQVLPELKKKYKPDLVMANVENLAHGKGVTEKTLQEMLDAGIDVFTSGNHVTRKGEYGKILEDKKYPLVRPANYPPSVPGREYLKTKPKTQITKHKDKNIYIINLVGRVFIQENFDCPFRKFDELEKLLKLKKNDIVIIDFHAEATSEKVALGWYLDGRVSCVLGTHTHIITADEKILPKGSGYITDAGMAGGMETVLGVDKDVILEGFLTQTQVRHEYPENGQASVDAVVVEIDEKSGKCKKIQRVNKQVIA